MYGESCEIQRNMRLILIYNRYFCSLLDGFCECLSCVNCETLPAFMLLVKFRCHFLYRNF